MSESDHHRILVEALAREIFTDPSWIAEPIVYCDIIEGPAATKLPPIIGCNRPDVFARDIGSSSLVIGEAKTSVDIDNKHTFEQLESFFDYLRLHHRGELWMGVPWLSAGTAMRVCRHARKTSDAQHVPFRVIAIMIGNTSVRRIWCE